MFSSGSEEQCAPDVGEESATGCGQVGAPKVSDSDTDTLTPRCQQLC
jgi:hypothetical protein